MNTKTLTIGGALVLLITTWISRVTGLVTDDQLLYAFWCLVDFLILTGIVLFFAAISYGISWGATEAYKRLYHHQKRWKEEAVKRKIYRCAIWSGGLTMLTCGSLFLLAETLTSKEQVVVGIFWSLASAFVGLSSPFLWRWTFDKLLPRFNRFVTGKATGENEAMDRPSEVPRE